MLAGIITKTIWQHSEPLPQETMEFLRGIALDYSKVKKRITLVVSNMTDKKRRNSLRQRLS